MTSDDLVKIVERRTEELREKLGLPESIHSNKYFEYGLLIGMESLQELLKAKAQVDDTTFTPLKEYLENEEQTDGSTQEKDA